ncbi:hypothetical protein Tco_0033933 [Tanacetum coccineum]
MRTFQRHLFLNNVTEVMQAYNATSNESHIPPPRAPVAPPTVLPPSLVLPLSPMFDPRDFFIPEEILPPQNEARFLSSSSTDSSTPLRQDFDQLETELQEACTQITGFQRNQIGHNDEIVLARVRTSTLEIVIKDIQIRHRSDIKSLLDKIYESRNHKGGTRYRLVLII